jgi:hypothetical protein
MGEVISNTSFNLGQYVNEFEDVFTSDGKVFFCQECGKPTVPQQHSGGKKHIATLVCLQKWPGRKSPICKSSTTSSSGSLKIHHFCAKSVKSGLNPIHIHFLNK